MSGKPTFTSYIGDPPVTQLISIDDNMEEEGSDTGAMAETKENENQSPLINLEDNSEETNNSDSLNRNSPVRLCGYLNKYKVGARGLGKAFKKRWFVHSDNTCKLLYYRTPQDIVPLGEMDVSNATLLLQTGQESDSPAAGRANIFKIRCRIESRRCYSSPCSHVSELMVNLQSQQMSRHHLLPVYDIYVPRDVTTSADLTGRHLSFLSLVHLVISSEEKVYYLEAPDPQTMMYWLQQLQKKRRAYSRKKTTLSTEKAQLKTVHEPSAGLVGGPVFSNFEQSSDFTPILAPVEAPSETVGELSANAPAGGILANLSIAHLKTELRNALTNIRTKRPSDSDNSGQPGSSKSLSPSPAPNPIQYTESTNTNPANSAEEVDQHKLSRFESLRRKIKSRSSYQEADSGSNRLSTDSSCNRCRASDMTLIQQQEEQQLIEEELEATRSVIRVLQKELDVIQRQLKTREEHENNPDAIQQFEKLKLQDKKIVDLEHLITTLNEEKEIQNVQLKMVESKVSSLEGELEMFKDSMRAKDEVIVSLTNQIFESQSRLVNHAGTNTTLKRKVDDIQELERLRDALSGYELQNKFLNKEILELNRLRNDDETRERELYMRCTEWEARYYQVHSKYLLVLEQLKIPVRDGDTSSQEVITQLLNDAMDLEESTERATDLLTSQSLDYSVSLNHRKYDKYGFLIGPQRPGDLVERATNLQRRSEELRGKDVDKEVSINVKWENYFISLGNRELHRSQELKNQIRDGIPYQYKERVWNACIGFRINKLKTILGPRYYQNLLDNMQKRSHRYDPAAKQIELDLLRTLPHNWHYRSLSSDGIPKLNRVLLAYTQHNPDIGYCQGQNRLVAIALLFLNEEDAFWCLVAIIEFLMPPEYYSRTLIAAQVDQRVLKDLMAEKLPQLASHIERLDVDLSLFSFNWFLTIFVDNIPTETFLRIWDVFLFEGNKVLFRFAMAFFKHREADILAIEDNITLHSYLRSLAERAVDINRLSQIAFHDMNPLPMRHIQARRQVHMVLVKAELDELDAMRSQFRVSRKEPARTHDDFSDDEL